MTERITAGGYTKPADIEAAQAAARVFVAVCRDIARRTAPANLADKTYFVAASALTSQISKDPEGGADCTADTAAFLRGVFGTLKHEGVNERDARAIAGAIISGVYRSPIMGRPV